jgi:multicomponent Na+:H+ antiporter subunit B
MTPGSRTYKRDVIIEVITKIMVPLILLFGFYVMIGTGGTGGGFQGGTILATAFILYITVFGTEKAREKMPESINTFFTSFGLFLYNGAGWIVILFTFGAAQWLNMSAFWPVADYVGTAGARSFLVTYMISAGIGLTVMASFVSQYFDLAWKEEEEMEGGGEG